MLDQLFSKLDGITKTCIHIHKNGWISELGKKEYEEMREVLLELGAEETDKLHNIGSGNTHLAEFILADRTIKIWVEIKKTKEEELAKLKAQVEKLEEEINGQSQDI